jgi:metal-dependent amidase/aminoacylase/carboxypeptidase family protein
MINKIKSLASDLHEEIRGIRRHIHQNPELSFQEFKTQSYVWQQLDEAGITNKQKIANTGIVAIIEGKNPSIESSGICGAIWMPCQLLKRTMCLTNPN